MAKLSAVLLAAILVAGASVRVIWLLPLLQRNMLQGFIHLAALTTLAVLLGAALVSGRAPLRWAIVLTIAALAAMLTLHDFIAIAVAPLTALGADVTWFTGLYCTGAQLADCLATPTPPVLGLILIMILAAALAASSLPELSRWARWWWTGDGPTRQRSVRRVVTLAAALVYPAVAASQGSLLVPADPIRLFFQASPQDAPLELLMAAPGPRAVPSAAPVRPRPLVLIIADSARADYFSGDPLYRHLTPTLTGLRDSGQLQDVGPAVAACTWSYCGIPAVIGSASWAGLQRGRPVNLVDALATHGYQSHFLLSGPHDSFFNFMTLYGRNATSIAFDDNAASGGDDRQILRALRRLHVTDPARTALVIHAMSIHSAGLRYDPPRSRAQTLARFTLSGRDPAIFRDYYELGIRQFDGLMRDILASLAAKGMGDALIVLTADHGERLGDHGLFAHRGRIDADVAMVPLIIIDPRRARWQRPPIASVLDAAPTLLTAIGAPLPPTWEGQPLQSQNRRVIAPIDMIDEAGAVFATPNGYGMQLCDLATGSVRSLTVPAGRVLARRPLPAWPSQAITRRQLGRCAAALH